MSQQEHSIASLAPTRSLLPGYHTALLTTFRRNGDVVKTPVGVLNSAGTLYFATRTSTGKVKRLRHNPRVTIGPCRRDGKPTGPSLAATARLLEGEELARIQRLFFGSLWSRLWLGFFRWRRPQDRWLIYALTLSADTDGVARDN